MSSRFNTGAPAVARTFDVTTDGTRLLGTVSPEQSASGTSNAAQINVVLNWFTELQQRVPTR